MKDNIVAESLKEINFFAAITDLWSSDVRYIDFILISRYFCSYRTVLKSILHLLMLDNY